MSSAQSIQAHPLTKGLVEVKKRHQKRLRDKEQLTEFMGVA